MMKVKGNSDLVRDENSRAIINTDSNTLKQARNAKRIALQRIEKEQSLEARIKKLESALESILNDKVKV